VVDEVKRYAKGKDCVMVCLDSNHTHSHVLDELKFYSPFVTVDSYIVVFDTIVEDLPDNYLPGRAWGRGDNPKTAVYEFLKSHPEFIIDRDIDNKLLVSVAPEGYLKRIS
jgi:cephalosporin hydroxylase